MARSRAFRQSEGDFAHFMRYTLAPDLKAMGMVATAKDAAKCGSSITRGVSIPAYARWLRTMLVPDLKSMGMKETAKDFARCARILGR